MLEIHPNCELCDKDLPAQSLQARICSYECTFCADCVDHRLFNVCPNCGGGFVARPIRPAIARRDGVSLVHQPASTRRRELQHRLQDLAPFVAGVRHIPPNQR